MKRGISHTCHAREFTHITKMQCITDSFTTVGCRAYVCVEDGQSRSSAQYRVVPGSSFWFVGVAPFSNDAQRNQYEGLDKTIYTTLQCAELLL